MAAPRPASPVLRKGEDGRMGELGEKGWRSEIGVEKNCQGRGKRLADKQ